ncbi:hypothetical protein SAMN05660649_02112 [Desulfotomaculum arcticum]|uniref:Uncharacterized protein n=1 Tax=Desulfotruncus arcticus DSM 17038 TaxID=1121424 RepID=A0A1I2T236_9FIRM|nr:hypothetical protein [Desulfotruncus arcticus]SFG58778.1 hypothetical protein SAMN05660649_02112 [Desulfotomaculum arcticum] [Desulfotruncus arcticus DSM 17038]
MGTLLLIGAGVLALYFGFKFVAGIIRMLFFLAIIGAGVWVYMNFFK